MAVNREREVKVEKISNSRYILREKIGIAEYWMSQRRKGRIRNDFEVALWCCVLRLGMR